MTIAIASSIDVAIGMDSFARPSALEHGFRQESLDSAVHCYHVAPALQRLAERIDGLLNLPWFAHNGTRPPETLQSHPDPVETPCPVCSHSYETCESYASRDCRYFRYWVAPDFRHVLGIGRGRGLEKEGMVLHGTAYCYDADSTS